MTKTMRTSITPRLVVPDSRQAMEFYTKVFGGEVLEHYFDPVTQRTVHAALSLFGEPLGLVDEDPPHGNVGAEALGGSPVMLHVTCDDPDAVAGRAVERGARVVFPVEDRFYGRREGRFIDPFGHVWIVGKEIEQLSSEEIERRMAGLHGG